MKRVLTKGLGILLILFVTFWFIPVTRAWLARALFSAALQPPMGRVVGFGFEYASPLLPVRRVLLTDKAIAFYHPRPSWEKHILVIPRKQVTTFFDLLKDKVYLESIYQTAHDVFILEKFNVKSYALLVNGGRRQDVKQVHFHFHEPKDDSPSVQARDLVLQTKDFTVYQLSERPLYLLLEPTTPLAPLSTWIKADLQQLASLDLPLEWLEQRYQLNQRGFSLIYGNTQKHLALHLTAGSLE
jgi:histidine triad (HIT) family protein